MNRVYLLTITVCIYMMVSLPHSSFAQCGFCTGGIPATVVTQTILVGPSNSSSASISFNKFYDASGATALTCYSFWDTISAVSTSTAHNEDPDSTIYSFKTDVNYTIKGPAGGGLSITEDSTITYGPDSLAAKGNPGDSVVNGPDTFFNSKTSKALDKFGVTPYTGSAGTIPITITFGGGATATGGSNYTYNIKTNFWGVFKLTYYICPSVPLATAIHDFTATQNGSSILLQWLTENEQNNSNYEIQISTDGKQFHTAGQAHGDPVAEGSSTKYQYQYNLDQANPGTVYFRIKRTDASGKVSYSAILIVRPGGAGDDPVSYQTYPNPATNSLVFRFNSAQTGRYLLELVNTAGQVVQQRPVTLTGTSELRLDLNPHPAKGLYFLRTSDLTHNQRYVSKVFIN